MLFIAFTIFLGEIGNPKRGNGLEGGSGVRPATSWASVFGVLVLGSSELGVSFVLCFIFRAVGFWVLCWVFGSS